MTKRNSSHKQKHGFTLIELLVVMSIIAILMGLVVGVSGAVMRKAAVSRARAEMSDLMNELEICRADQGSYPADWAAFFTWYDTKYAGTLYTITEKSNNKPIDPWGKEYYYTDVREFTYLIRSYGPDGRTGSGNDALDDITNRNGAL